MVVCSILDAGQALAEARRILRPGGHLRFVEHGLASDPQDATWQGRLTPLWRHCAEGCHLNSKMDDLILAAGFKVAELTTGYARVPRAMTYMLEGVAV